MVLIILRTREEDQEDMEMLVDDDESVSQNLYKFNLTLPRKVSSFCLNFRQILEQENYFALNTWKLCVSLQNISSLLNHGFEKFVVLDAYPIFNTVLAAKTNIAFPSHCCKWFMKLHVMDGGWRGYYQLDISNDVYRSLQNLNILGRCGS